MDIIHRLHYLVLSQKSDLMTMDREQRMRVRRQSSLPEYTKANRTRQRLEQAYFNDVSVWWIHLSSVIALTVVFL